MPSKRSAKPELVFAIIGGLFLITAASVTGVIPTLISVANTVTPLPSSTPMPTPTIKITEPVNGSEVSGVIAVSGISSNSPKNTVIWIFTMQPTVLGERRFWPQRYDGTGAITPLANGNWSGKAYFSVSDVGRFEIWAMVTESSISGYFEDYIDSNTMRTPIPILGLPTGAPPFREFLALDNIAVTVRGK